MCGAFRNRDTLEREGKPLSLARGVFIEGGRRF